MKSNEVFYFHSDLLQRKQENVGVIYNSSDCKVEKLTESNQREVEDKLVNILIEEVEKSRLECVLSMEMEQLVKIVLKICFNLGQGYISQNLLIKHTLDEQQILCMIELAIKARGLELFELASSSNILNVIDQSVRVCLSSETSKMAYIVIKSQVDDIKELCQIQQTFSMLFSSSEFHHLLDKKLIDELIWLFLSKNAQNPLNRNHSLNRDQILEYIQEMIVRRVKVIFLHKLEPFNQVETMKNAIYLKCLTILLPTIMTTRVTSDSNKLLVLDRVRESHLLDEKQIKVCESAFNVYNKISRFFILQGCNDLQPISLRCTVNKVFLLYSALLSIFLNIKQSFRSNDSTYRY